MPVDQTHRPLVVSSRLSRRTTLRLLAAAPVVGGAAIAGRTGGVDDSLAAARAALQGNATPGPAATACAASPAAAPAASPGGSPTPAVTVKMTTQLRFDPDHVTIRAGETITWVNAGTVPHTATGDPAQNPVATSHPECVQLPDGAEPWGSPLLQPGESYAHTFTTPGEYHYICIPHVLSGMRGTITVKC
jgi:plastocyanin